MHVDEHTIEIDGAPVFYRSAAWSGIPALYLHGSPTSCDDWTAFLERTGGFAPDLLGFGRSGKGANLDFSLSGHAAFIERFLAHVGVDRVKLVAHDWGAGGGLTFAQDHPERIDRLVLCDALPLLDGFRWHRLARLWRRPVIGELVMGATLRSLLARGLRDASARPEAWPDERVAAVWEQFDQGTQRAILRLHRDAGPERLAAAGAGLDTLDAPALVVWGEQDPWFPAALADAYGARLPHATVRRVDGAGHWPWLDQPAVVDEIAQFLSQ